MGGPEFPYPRSCSLHSRDRAPARRAPRRRLPGGDAVAVSRGVRPSRALTARAPHASRSPLSTAGALRAPRTWKSLPPRRSRRPVAEAPSHVRRSAQYASVRLRPRPLAAAVAAASLTRLRRLREMGGRGATPRDPINVGKGDVQPPSPYGNVRPGLLRQASSCSTDLGLRLACASIALLDWIRIESSCTQHLRRDIGFADQRSRRPACSPRPRRPPWRAISKRF